MSTGGFLQIEPTELQFPFELKKQISCSLRLTNNSHNYVAFKVKTTNPKKYCVRPNTGIVMPNFSCEVTVTMQAQKEAPPFMQCSDKFLIQSVVMSPGVTKKDFTPETFNKEIGKQVDEYKLKAVYVVPPQGQPKTSINGFLQIEPAELQFPFELKKQVSCSMKLRNKSDNYVAFKVKTTNPKKYCVRPNTGIMTSNSSCDVKVTMQAQKEAPPFMQCSDKFLIQSVVMSPGVTEKDFTSTTFNKESGKQVDEYKLKAVYVVPPQVKPPSPVQIKVQPPSTVQIKVQPQSTVHIKVQQSSSVQIRKIQSNKEIGKQVDVAPQVQPVQRKKRVDLKIKSRNLHVSTWFCNLQVSCFSFNKKVTI